MSSSRMFPYSRWRSNWASPSTMKALHHSVRQHIWLACTPAFLACQWCTPTAAIQAPLSSSVMDCQQEHCYEHTSFKVELEPDRQGNVYDRYMIDVHSMHRYNFDEMLVKSTTWQTAKLFFKTRNWKKLMLYYSTAEFLTTFSRTLYCRNSTFV